jgi:hypothetical protein
MGNKTNNLENELLALIFNNTTLAGMGDTTGLVGSTADGNLYVSLHTAFPGEAGTQSTSEASYTGYARVAVSRTDGWTVSTNTAENAAAITFGQKTDAGTETITYVGIGADETGAGDLYYCVPLAVRDSTVLVVDASADDNLIVCPDMPTNLSTDDPVIFETVVGDALPSGITAGTVYYAGNIVADGFEIDDASTFATPLTLGNGSGRVVEVLPKTISQNDTPEIAAGGLVITED